MHLLYIQTLEIACVFIVSENLRNAKKFFIVNKYYY